jgi:hypothetical protein
MQARPEITGKKPAHSPQSDLLADDLLEGVAAIATFTGLKPRRVFYLAENGMLPLFKLDIDGAEEEAPSLSILLVWRLVKPREWARVSPSLDLPAERRTVHAYRQTESGWAGVRP